MTAPTPPRPDAEAIARWLLGLQVGDGKQWDLQLRALALDIRAGVPWRVVGT